MCKTRGVGGRAGVQAHGAACLPAPAPAALLMGCSSGRLRTERGATGNACVGPVATYAAHGSPCVVVNLWDVTDRDIDRFTHRLLSRCAAAGSLRALPCSNSSMHQVAGRLARPEICMVQLAMSSQSLNH